MGWVFAYGVLSYLTGAVPTAYLIAKGLRGIDIRRVGSGNPGATNVFRSVGKGAGIATLALDLAKGFVPTFLALKLFRGTWPPVAAGLAAVAGHTWPVFLKFQGGKGVATSAGVFLALLPLSTLAGVAAFGAGFGVSRHVSVGSLAGAVVLPLAAFWQRGPAPESFLALGLGLLVVVRHIPNIRRLLKGQEWPPRPPEKEEHNEVRS